MSKFFITFKFNGIEGCNNDNIKMRIGASKFHEKLGENVFIICESEEEIHKLYNDFVELTEDDYLVIYDMDNRNFVNIEFKNNNTTINQNIEKMKMYIAHSCMDIVGKHYKS